MKNNYTYRFEIRFTANHELIGLTDVPGNAIRMAKNAGGYVDIIDNDAKHPIAARLKDGAFTVISGSFRQEIIGK